MSQDIQQLIALANQAAEVAADMREEQIGGGGQRDLPTGYTLAHLVEVVELGSQPQEFGGKAKQPQQEVQLGWLLYSKGFCNDDGTPYLFRQYPLALSRNGKAGAFLQFKQMNYDGQRKNFAQFIGQPFLLKFEEGKVKPDGKKARAKIVQFNPPVDAVSNAPYPMPALDLSVLRLFLWEFPTLEGWNSLYIEGSTDDGRSRNYVQETITSATDFAGSPLEILLRTNNLPIPIAQKPTKAPAAPATAAPAAPPAAVPAAPVAAPAAPVAAPAAVPAHTHPAPVAVAPVAAVEPPFTPTNTVAAPAAPAVVAPPAVPAGLPAAPALPTV